MVAGPTSGPDDATGAYLAYNKLPDPDLRRSSDNKIESLAHHFIIIFLGVLAVGFFSAFSPGAGRINSDRQTRYNS